MQANIFSFDSGTPGIVYLDAGFIVNFSVEGSKYHEPCTGFVRKLRRENIPSLISNLTPDEVEMYRGKEVSLSKAAEITGVTAVEFKENLANRGVPLISEEKSTVEMDEKARKLSEYLK